MPDMVGPVAVVDAPSNLGLRPPGPGEQPGVRRLASTLRERGIVERLGAADAGVVVPPAYSPGWDGRTVRNGEAIRGFSVELAGRVERLVREGRLPLVLGGDCSVLLGSTLALRRIGRYGLVFLDGHLDFRHPGNSPVVGAAAGEDLALVTGRGEERLTDIERLEPLVRDADVVALGERERDPATSDVYGTEITVRDLAAVRALGPAQAARKAVEKFDASGLDGFWIHLDADVLDDSVMPAVDSRQPDGLGYAELTEILEMLLSSGTAVGMEITIFDPELDPTGRIAEQFTTAIVTAFSGARRAARRRT